MRRLNSFIMRTWRSLHSSGKCWELGEILHNAEHRRESVSRLLDESGIQVTSQSFSQALGGVADSEVALDFLTWAGKQPGFMHTLESYSRVLRIVVESRGQDGYSYFREQLALKANYMDYMVVENTILSCMWEDDPSTAESLSRSLTRKDMSTYRIVISGLFKARLAETASAILRKMPAWMPSMCLEIIDDACTAGESRAGYEVLVYLHEQGLDVKEHDIPSSLVQGLFRAYDLEEGLRNFTWLTENGYKVGRKSYMYVIDILCKGGRTDTLLKVYEDMNVVHAPDIASCNTVLGGLVAAGRVNEALEILEHGVRVAGLSPNSDTYCVFVEGLVKQGKLDDAFGIYQEAVDNGQVSRISGIYRMLFEAFSKEKRDKETVVLFERYVDVGGEPTVHMYSDIIASLCRVGRVDEALEVFESFPLKGVKIPSGHLLFIELSRAKRTLDSSRVLQHLLERGQLRQCYAINSTVDALCKEGMLDEAEAWFRELKQYQAVNAVTYNILMNAYFSLGRVEEGVALYNQMKGDGLAPSISTYNTLIKGLCIGKKMDEALGFFSNLVGSGAKVDLITYNTVVDGLCKADRIPEALDLLDQMLARGGELTTHPYNSIMDAYFKSGKFQAATRLLNRMEKDGLKPHDVTYSILIDGLCKAKRLDEARSVFSSFLDKGRIPDEFMISSLIDGLCKGGQVDEGYGIFELITKNGCMLNDVCSNIVINGLCRTNRISQAKAVFNRVVKGQLRPDVVTYTTMINGLCRANKVAEARALVKKLIARGGKPDSVLFTTLIAGMCMAGRLDEARKVFDVEMKEAGCVPSTVTCNVLVNGFGMAGRNGEAQELLQRFVELGIQPDDWTFTTMTKNLVKSEGWDAFAFSELMTTKHS